MRQFISNARLNSYRKLLKLKSDSQTIHAYYWNKALCGSIYPAMQSLEVTLRNALNESVKTHHSGKYKNDDWWFEHLVNDIQNKKIKSMSQKSQAKWMSPAGKRQKKSHAEQQVASVQRDLRSEGRSPVLHDDVISRMTFGFWVSMLNSDCEDVTHKSLLWPNLLPYVFPNTPFNPKRLKIEEKFHRTKDLRNRMSHHEPIWKFYTIDQTNKKPDYNKPIYGLKPSLSLLSKSYDEILELIRWMSAERYQAFLDAGLDKDFRKLCSEDGFNAFVDPDSIQHRTGFSRFRRELPKYSKLVAEGSLLSITKGKQQNFILGLVSPKR